MIKGTTRTRNAVPAIQAALPAFDGARSVGSSAVELDEIRTNKTSHGSYVSIEKYIFIYITQINH